MVVRARPVDADTEAITMQESAEAIGDTFLKAASGASGGDPAKPLLGKTEYTDPQTGQTETLTMVTSQSVETPETTNSRNLEIS